MTDILIGIVIGVGASFAWFGILLLVLECFRTNPFENATVEDFLHDKEGG